MPGGVSNGDSVENLQAKIVVKSRASKYRRQLNQVVMVADKKILSIRLSFGSNAVKTINNRGNRPLKE